MYHGEDNLINEIIDINKVILYMSTPEIFGINFL